MKAILLPSLFSFSLAAASPAQTCSEVVRDSSGRIVKTIDRQKSAGGSVQATTRDASGRIIGTAPRT
jgi:YD repeat-containing protein